MTALIVVVAVQLLILLGLIGYPLFRLLQKGHWSHEFARYEVRLKKLKPLPGEIDAEILAGLEADMKVIAGDFTKLLGQRVIYNGIKEMVRNNPRLQVSNFFYSWMRSDYASTMAVGIRRLVDDDSRTVSLRNIVTKVMNNHKLFTQERHIDFYRRAGHSHMGEEEFARFCAEGATVLDRRMVQDDLRGFKATAQPIKEYVDSVLAHHDRITPERFPTFTDLDAALDTLHAFAQKYRLLLLCIGGDMTPTYQDYWQAIFEFAWIQPEPEPV